MPCSRPAWRALLRRRGPGGEVSRARRRPCRARAHGERRSSGRQRGGGYRSGPRAAARQGRVVPRLCARGFDCEPARRRRRDFQRRRRWMVNAGEDPPRMRHRGARGWWVRTLCPASAVAPPPCYSRQRSDPHRVATWTSVTACAVPSVRLALLRPSRSLVRLGRTRMRGGRAGSRRSTTCTTPSPDSESCGATSFESCT